MDKSKHYVIIAEGTCGGQESQFAAWIAQHYSFPEISVEAAARSGIYTEDHQFVCGTGRLWEVYGRSDIEPADPYVENGFQNRAEYLRDLADGSDNPQAVYALADLLGPSEDFDGLICALEDDGLL